MRTRLQTTSVSPIGEMRVVQTRKRLFDGLRRRRTSTIPAALYGCFFAFWEPVGMRSRLQTTSVSPVGEMRVDNLLLLCYDACMKTKRRGML